MKKILIIHNRYQNLGGEDIAVTHEVALLKEKYDVKELYFDNKIDSIFNFLKLVLTLKNKKSVRKLDKIYSNFLPDFVYIHNTWFNASLDIFNYLEKKDAKIIIKIHNFRYNCTKNFKSKQHLRNGNVCVACGFKYKKLQYFNKYFNESYLKSLFVLLYGRKYFKILLNSNFKIAVLTEFHKNYLNELGVNLQRLHVVPNFIDSPQNKYIQKNNQSIVYAGRVSEEKGLKELVTAFKNLDIPSYNLKIVGDGPLLKELIDSNTSNNIEFLGQVDNEKVHGLIANSVGVITATKLLEGQPTILFEASLLKKPCIFPETGGLLEFFPNNYPLSYQQFNYSDLENKIKLLLQNQDRSSSIGEKNYNYLSSKFSKEITLEKYNLLFN